MRTHLDMKKGLMLIRSIFYKEKKAEAWKDIKYLLVLGYKRYSLPHILGEEYCYETDEFETKEEVLKFIEEEVSKSDKKRCRLYKEIKIK